LHRKWMLKFFPAFSFEEGHDDLGKLWKVSRDIAHFSIKSCWNCLWCFHVQCQVHIVKPKNDSLFFLSQKVDSCWGSRCLVPNWVVGTPSTEP
jgi:hypothetical protein